MVLVAYLSLLLPAMTLLLPPTLCFFLMILLFPPFLRLLARWNRVMILLIRFRRG